MYFSFSNFLTRLSVCTFQTFQKYKISRKPGNNNFTGAGKKVFRETDKSSFLFLIICFRQDLVLTDKINTKKQHLDCIINNTC